MLDLTHPGWQSVLNLVLGGGILLFCVRHVLERRKRRAEIDLSDAQASVQKALADKAEVEAWNLRLEGDLRRLQWLEASGERLELKLEQYRKEKAEASDRAAFLEDRVRINSAEVRLVRISKHNLLNYIQELEAHARLSRLKCEQGDHTHPPFAFKTYAELCGEEDEGLAALARMPGASSSPDIHTSLGPDAKRGS